MAHPDIAELISNLPGSFQADAAGDLDIVLQFNLTGEKAGEFHAVIKDGKCTAVEGKHDSPTTSFTAEGTDWLDVIAGKSDGTSLFMQGKLSVEGDMGLAMRLQTLFKNEAS